MELSLIFSIIFIIIIVSLLLLFKKKEKFDIPLRSSSAWDWNLGPGYGAGYGTGYGLYGEWPAMVPKEPWKYWMWGRRPLIFTKPFTPVPQIDYNNAPLQSKPISNYNISILPKNGKITVAINGMSNKTLQLDRLRNYYFHIYSPGAPIMFTADGVTPFAFEPIENGNVQLNFDENDPAILYYMIKGYPDSGGIIYLNDLKN